MEQQRHDLIGGNALEPGEALEADEPDEDRRPAS